MRGGRDGVLGRLEGVDRLSQFWPVIMWDVASVAKSTGGVRLVGPEAGTRGGERGERKFNTGATAISAGKPERNHRGTDQLLPLPM